MKVLVTDGYPYQLAERLKRPVYQLTELMRKRFVVRETPSLIAWPKGSDYLTVSSIAIPDSEVEVSQSEED